MPDSLWKSQTVIETHQHKRRNIMKVEQALSILDTVVSRMTLTRIEHNELALALRVLDKATQPQEGLLPGEEG